MKRLAVGYRLCLHLYPWTPPGKAAVAAAARSIVQDAEDGFDVMHVNLTGGVASLIAGAPSEALEFARRMRTGLWNQHYGGIIGGVALARMGESEAAHRRLAEVANTALGSAGFHLTTDCLVSFAALRIARGDVARGAGLLESAVVRLGPIHSQRSPQGGALYAHCVDLVRARLDRATRHSAREAARSRDPVEVLREEISAL